MYADSGSLWTANQWNEDEVPGGVGKFWTYTSYYPLSHEYLAGAWNLTGTCNGLLHPATATAAKAKASEAVSAKATAAAKATST